jgi:Domain of unknown function (DUF4375)
MFGWRKDKEPQQRAANSQGQRSGAPTGIGKFTTVIVPRSAVLRASDPEKAYDLVQAVVNFVNAMMGEGIYSRDEIPAKAMQAYHADFYLAQVNNGGHSQFIHNCQGSLKHILGDVRAGLTGMKAEKHLPIFEQMASWIAQHPDEASKQTGFQGGREPLLDPLDKLLYAAEKEAPMIAQSALWIASWPELRAVADADYREAMRQALMMNPLREARLMWRSVGNLRQQMTEWFHVGVGLACANASPPEVKLAVGGGAVFDIEGEKQTAFHVRTNADKPRLCVVTDKHAAAYEVVDDNPPMPEIGDVEGMKQAIADGRLARYKGIAAGKKLSHLRPEAISGVIALAKDYKAPAAVDLLLRRAGIDPSGAMVSPMTVTPRTDGPVLHSIVAAGGQAFFAMSASAGGALMRASDNQQVAGANRSDVEEHAARAEAGAIKLTQG